VKNSEDHQIEDHQIEDHQINVALLSRTYGAGSAGRLILPARRAAEPRGDSALAPMVPKSKHTRLVWRCNRKVLDAFSYVKSKPSLRRTEIVSPAQDEPNVCRPPRPAAASFRRSNTGQSSALMRPTNCPPAPDHPQAVEALSQPIAEAPSLQSARKWIAANLEPKMHEPAPNSTNPSARPRARLPETKNRDQDCPRRTG
jgi:hypothetical protein